MAGEREALATVSGLEGAGAAETGAARPQRALWLDRALALITEVPAAILVAVEIVVLFAGVVSRYVFHAPLTWSDELASILFLWLAMLGAVIALRRGEHMRLTAIVTRVPERWRALLETLAALVVAVFVVLVKVPAHEYTLDEWAILTPALQLHNSLRAAAIEVGAALMMVIALARLIERASLGQAAAALLITGAVALALLLLRPTLLAMGNWNLVVFFVVLVALAVAIGVPIAFAFGVSTLSYLALVALAARELDIQGRGVLRGKRDLRINHCFADRLHNFVHRGCTPVEITRFKPPTAYGGWREKEREKCQPRRRQPKRRRR